MNLRENDTTLTTLPREIFVLKNRNDPNLSETNFYARLC